MIPLKKQGHRVPHLKALRYGIYETRGLNCDSTFSIFQDVLKIANLLQSTKMGLVDSQMVGTVCDFALEISRIKHCEAIYSSC